MGLDVTRVPPGEFIRWAFGTVEQREVLARLHAVATEDFSDEPWLQEPHIPMRDFPSSHPTQRVGSYTAYGVFVLLMEELLTGVQDSELDDDDDLEREALQAFRSEYNGLRVPIKGARQFLDMPDKVESGAFVPVLFDELIEFKEVTLGSLPTAVTVLREFAGILKFDLDGPYEDEENESGWQPLATMRNIARIFHKFMTADTSAVVLYE